MSAHFSFKRKKVRRNESKISFVVYSSREYRSTSKCICALFFFQSDFSTPILLSQLPIHSIEKMRILRRNGSRSPILDVCILWEICVQWRDRIRVRRIQTENADTYTEKPNFVIFLMLTSTCLFRWRRLWHEINNNKKKERREQNRSERFWINWWHLPFDWFEAINRFFPRWLQRKSCVAMLFSHGHRFFLCEFRERNKTKHKRKGGEKKLRINSTTSTQQATTFWLSDTDLHSKFNRFSIKINLQVDECDLFKYICIARSSPFVPLYLPLSRRRRFELV